MKSEADWRQTVKTVEDLHSLVRTMKALSAVSIKQYETALNSLAEYDRTLQLGFMALFQSGDFRPDVVGVSKDQPLQVAAIIFGSDQGLCGRFNEIVVDYALDKLNGMHIRLADRHIMVVGERPAGLLEQADVSIQGSMGQPGSASTISNTVESLSITLEQWKAEHGVEQVFFFYNEHTSSSAHQPQMRRLLPVDHSLFQSLFTAPWPARGLPQYSIDGNELFAALIRQYLYVSLFHATAHSLASEHASRLQTMQGAERNIQERLQTLEGQYHRSRQAAITEELLDVVGGYEVLNKQSGVI